jgi:hypothetical protein
MPMTFILRSVEPPVSNTETECGRSVQPVGPLQSKLFLKITPTEDPKQLEGGGNAGTKPASIF